MDCINYSVQNAQKVTKYNKHVKKTRRLQRSESRESVNRDNVISPNRFKHKSLSPKFRKMKTKPNMLGYKLIASEIIKIVGAKCVIKTIFYLIGFI